MTGEGLVGAIVAALQGEGFYRESVVEDQERVAEVRRCGRKAGRVLGRPVRTLVMWSEDGTVADVHVVDTSEPDPNDELARTRMARRMRAAINSL